MQDDRDIWEAKLPKDYQQLIQMSNSQKIYSDMSKMDCYKVLVNGILLQKGTQVIKDCDVHNMDHTLLNIYAWLSSSNTSIHSFTLDEYPCIATRFYNGNLL